MNVSSWSNVIFAKGQVQEKIAALEALARQRTKASVRLIRHASKDDSSDVSYIAATAFIAMERPLLQQLDFWQKNVQQSPDNYHAYTHLGKTYYELCYLGLADAQNQTSFLIRALDAFKQARQIHGCPNNIYLDMGKTAMMLSNHHLASEYFQEYLTQSPSDIGGHLWNAELLYLQGRFGDLRVLMRSIKEKNLPESHRFRTLFEVWT